MGLLNESTLLQSTVKGVKNDMMISIGLRKILNFTAHSSMGDVSVELIVSTIIVDSKYGHLELVGGASARDCSNIIDVILKENIHFEDVPTVVEGMCNYKAIDEKVEYKVKNGRAKSICC